MIFLEFMMDLFEPVYLDLFSIKNPGLVDFWIKK